jgi:hypothetical protein
MENARNTIRKFQLVANFKTDCLKERPNLFLDKAAVKEGGVLGFVGIKKAKIPIPVVIQAMTRN